MFGVPVLGSRGGGFEVSSGGESLFIFVWDFPHKVGGSDIFLFLSFFIYLSTDRSARHVVSSLGVST